jgi:osmoprotectant transport system ATP-binding protein
VFVTHDIDEAIKMADRIAILNIGGVIEQYAPPEEILRDPASEFVEDFVGEERGLKRLALIKVSATHVEKGPVVQTTASAAEARKEMERFGFDWITVIEPDGRLRGWVDGPALRGKRTVKEAEPKKFSAYLTASDSLRQALDAIVTSRTQVAVVATDEDRYLGILTLERISQEIVS